jgi:hypothetical protein
MKIEFDFFWIISSIAFGSFGGLYATNQISQLLGIFGMVVSFGLGIITWILYWRKLKVK